MYNMLVKHVVCAYPTACCDVAYVVLIGLHAMSWMSCKLQNQTPSKSISPCIEALASSYGCINASVYFSGSVNLPLETPGDMYQVLLLPNSYFYFVPSLP